MEEIIGVKPETAIQRWRKLCSAVKNHKQRFCSTATFSVRSNQQAAAAIRSTNFQGDGELMRKEERLHMLRAHLFHYKEKFRLAVLISHAVIQFTDGIEYCQDKEQTERPEEVNTATSVIERSLSLWVSISHALFAKAALWKNMVWSAHCTLLCHRNQTSATDSDGHGTRVIPLNQTVLDIVNNTNGSALNWSPLYSIGSDDYNSYGQTHQAPVTTSVWIFSVTGIGFETVSAFLIRFPPHASLATHCMACYCLLWLYLFASWNSFTVP